MSGPWRDALFGVDGTEPPVPSDRSGGPDVAVPPPFVLPPIPPIGMTREAVAAALGEDLPAPAEKDPAAAPAPPPTTPQADAEPADVPAPPPAPPPPPPRAGTRLTYNTRPVIAPVSPASPPRGGGMRSHQQLMAGSRSLESLRNARLRIVRPVGRLPTHTRSNGGAGAFFLAMSIVFAVLLYFIISGIVEAFVRLIP